MMKTGSRVPESEVVTQLRELLLSCTVADTLRHQETVTIPKFW